VGGFEVQEILGRGGMGTVYAAVHPQIGKRVAIKVVSAAYAGNEELYERFRREAHVVSRVQHPGLVNVFTFDRLPDGRPYLVMELLEGEALAERIARAPLQLPELLDIFGQILDALGAAHEGGVVHRDLKPENIFLCQVRGRLQVKLLDFGLAKDTDAGARAMTRTGITMGTPAYMSPEQCRGRGVDHRTDLYALGAVLYEVVTGDPPFLSDTVLDLLNQHLNEAPVPPSRRAVLPAALEAVILRALEKRAEDRYQTAAEMLAALQAVATPEEAAGMRLERKPAPPAQPAAAQGEGSGPPISILAEPEDVHSGTLPQQAAPGSGSALGEVQVPKDAAPPPGPVSLPGERLRPKRALLGLAFGAGAALVLGLGGLWLWPQKAPTPSPAPVQAPQGAAVTKAPPARPPQPQPPSQPQPQPQPPSQPPPQPPPQPLVALVPPAKDPPRAKEKDPPSYPAKGARPASLTVYTGRKDAEVYIDGKPRGRGAVIRTQAPAGKHQVAVGAYGFQDVRTTVDLQPGKDFIVRVELRRKPKGRR
jgi:serine/threonine-protein kinase